jgi:UDP:flavonoid glycosyltransferase YjiC (YdhE family)
MRSDAEIPCLVPAPLPSGRALRVLITVQPSWSHLTTILPIARELLRQGHDVRLASSPSMAERIGRLGLAAFPAGPDWDASRANDFFPGFLEARASTQARHLVSLAGRGMVPALLAATAAWAPDVILRDVTEFGAMIVGELLGVPVVVVGIGLRPPLDWLLQTFAPKLRQLREQHGLPPHPQPRDVTGQLWLSSFPPSLGIANADTLDEHHVRPVPAEEVDVHSAPEWLADIGPDAVYVTLGTVFNHNVHLLSMIARALGRSGIDVVATTGENVAPAALGELPGNVHVASYIPQSLVAPHVRAVICHGGYNTVIGALSAGLPVCCVPLAFDHPRNAVRCVELGVGTAITTHTPTAGLPWARAEDVTESAVLAAIEPLLTQDRYRLGAGRVREEIQAMPGPDVAVRRVEAIARAR